MTSGLVGNVRPKVARGRRFKSCCSHGLRIGAFRARSRATDRDLVAPNRDGINQSISDLEKQLYKDDTLMEKIEYDEHWESRMSHALGASLWIPEMYHLLLGKASKSGIVRGTSLMLETCSLLSGITGGSRLDLSSFLGQLVASGGHLQVPQDTARGGPRTGGSSSSNNIPSYNDVLFGKYKSLKVNGKPINSFTGR